MRITNQVSVCVAVTLGLLACKNSQPSKFVMDFVKQLDGKSLEEAKARLEEENANVAAYLRFMETFKDDDKPEHVKPEDEREGTPFAIPGAAQMEAAYERALADIGFNQTFEKTYSLLQPDGRSLRKSHVDNPDFIVKEVYFHDGTKQVVELDLKESKRLNSLKTVDSMLVEVQYSYPVKTAVVSLDGKGDKGSYKGSTLKVERIQDNFVRVSMGKAAYKDYLEIEAFNKEGKLISRSSYTKAPEGGENIGVLLKDYQKILDGFLKRLEKKEYKDIAALQKDILEKMPAVTPFDDVEEGNVDAYFYGNVAKVKVHLEDEKKEGKKTMVLRNLAPNYTGLLLVADEATQKAGFISAATGKTVIPFNYQELHQVSPWFFGTKDASGFRYFRLDTAAQQLVAMNEHVEELTGDLVKVAPNRQEESKFGVMTNTGQLLLPIEFDDISIDPSTNLIFANKNREDWPLGGMTIIYDNTGKQIGGPYKIHNDFTHGLLLVKDIRDNASFINPKGEKVIDLKGYYNIEPFTEGLASMEDETGNTGFLDIQGKVAIPFEYRSATPFNQGLSMVERTNSNNVTEAALINTSGAVVVPFAASPDTDTDGEGPARIYTLQNKKFDAWGKELKK
ncbi:WG repeat-containing protein [Chitinophaga oryzae]|uniref:WG repeat-containing protein n=1 Tax=Chitinophaga oryzae TaxID=2725414 RepID=A0AAE7D8K4_9BACT|nr:WG repeat-containing protein [Chitinophaga oryzae]QJB32879.1 WG repeat-containing protein [Chitinophaga oryzae]QJB39342.1 WG repeat-containing protein [Chitinophaga oryzae]